MKTFIIMFYCTLLSLSVVSQNAETNIIPQPQQVKYGPGSFRFDQSVRVLCETAPGVLYSARMFTDMMKISTGVELQFDSVRRKNTQYISIFRDDSAKWCGPEGYHLVISGNGIEIVALTEAGIFYALQTLRQLMPPEFSQNKKIDIATIEIPCMTISDKPRFTWRGMNFDCGRHFMEVDFIKRYIDLLAFHKMNVLHWHLTEDQGWRIEIKKYPKLTKVGAWRKEDDGSMYGGFYTQDQIREVVAYAAERYITVVPEIEMPGHVVAALASYPQLSCAGGPFEVEKRWGVFNDIYCAGNDSVFIFLQDVLTEVMDLFPSKYIHIGGDEAPKVRWEACPKCQERMKSENLKSEEELQSYFIRRIEKFLNANNRQLIGWDEILEGGLAPSATVQSWRGMEGGLEAASQGHDAIMSPTSHCYFDYSTTNINLEQVYSFEPIPADLPADKHHHILGSEACMWTEVAPQALIDSRMFPRLCALSEVVWSSPQGRSFTEFQKRMQFHYKRLNNLGVQYGYERDPIKLTTRFDKNKNAFVAVVEHGQPNLTMYYTTDGSEPGVNSAKYSEPVIINTSAEIKVAAIRPGSGKTAVESRKVCWHKALGKEYTITYPYHKKYIAGGDSNMTDGLRGTNSYRDNLWQGYEGLDFEAIVNLGDKMKISKVSIGTLQSSLAWIYHPLKLEVFVSTDAADWKKVGEVENKISQTDAATSVQDLTVCFKSQKVKFVKVYCSAMHQNPDWHPGAGGKAWLFIDEIIVE
ncbi:MAG: hypothetical protein A2W93_01415 [Bacteroidetes bacterium GWF2_43_63]|nr:MAG: hypothetical protein A2W94_10655 [Bacteroidetes bacterium GWE2_42_42]OFY55734.1 MAG: hypothetical protein A2W93_01415 [Bacteroidetes bacterium GWF2_43_63]HBG69456.1 beta-N-acetylhexosaminidase [Bacteroidales bacterium]HCB61378.1 beta-N-acetylhexosaminidase [Bacteroidales bacterium]HCY24252.1 beta-N-acetylhexosaminidase [Bacteroidales bacterium]